MSMLARCCQRTVISISGCRWRRDTTRLATYWALSESRSRAIECVDFVADTVDDIAGRS